MLIIQTGDVSVHNDIDHQRGSDYLDRGHGRPEWQIMNGDVICPTCHKFTASYPHGAISDHMDLESQPVVCYKPRR